MKGFSPQRGMDGHIHHLSYMDGCRSFFCLSHSNRSTCVTERYMNEDVQQD